MSEKLTYEYVDGRCVFSDGWSYALAPRVPGQTYVDPFEYRRMVLGEGLPKASAADLAVARGRKVDLGTIDHRG